MYVHNLSVKQVGVIDMKAVKNLIKDNKFKSVGGGDTYYDNDEKVDKCYLIPRFDVRGYFSVFSFDGQEWLPSLD